MRNKGGGGVTYLTRGVACQVVSTGTKESVASGVSRFGLLGFQGQGTLTGCFAVLLGNGDNISMGSMVLTAGGEGLHNGSEEAGRAVEAFDIDLRDVDH